jgi:hypothetical protein
LAQSNEYNERDQNHEKYTGKEFAIKHGGAVCNFRVPVQRDVLGRTPILAAGIVMKTRTHFTFRIDKLDVNGEVFEHVAGLEDFELAVATYEAACKRWPGDPIMLRQGARVVKDSRKTRLA